MAWYHRLFNVARSERVSRDIEREMEFHIAEKADALRAEGLSDEHALREARRRFGNRGIQAERTRDADILGWLDSFRADARYAMRALGRTPVFTVVAVASLAIGIGANTAIYTLIDALILRPLPSPQSEELVQVTAGDDAEYFTNPLWEELRDRRTGFASLAAFSEASLDQAEGGEARRIGATWVSGEYFTVVGLPPTLGRLLAPSDDVRGCPPIAVLGHGFWRSEFGGTRDVVGRTLTLDGFRFEIVGVAPEGFRGFEVGRESQVYMPLCSRAVISGQRVLEARSSWWIRVIGRREPGIALDQLGERVAAVAPAAYAATVPPDWSAEDKAEYATRGFDVAPAERGLSGLRAFYSGALYALMGAVALVLLIACANVANLLLARAAAREREVAIRLAMGAGRGRLVRQLLTESLLLAVMGAAAGLLVAQWGTRALVRLIGGSIALDLSLDPRVLGFTAAAAALTALLFGLAPSWRGTRVSPQSAMKARGRGVVEGHGRFTLGKALVVAQVALSLVLLVGAGLLIGSLHNLRTLDPGFRPEGVLLVSVDLRRTGPDAPHHQMHRQLLDALRAIPGVRSASTADLTPIGRSSWNDVVVVEGFEPSKPQDALAWFNAVSEDYFATLGTRFVAGRDFDHTDVPGAPANAIMNESAARRFFGDASPIGRSFRLRGGDQLSDPFTIVGLVEDAKYSDLREENSGTVYLAASQNLQPGPFVSVVLRTGDAMEAVVPAVKAAIADVHPLATIDLRTLSQQISASLNRERMLATLSALFAGVALLLAMLGLYGVMAYAVARRRNEIGVRIALGADRQRILRLVMSDVGRVVVAGLALGILGAMGLGSVVRAFLYGVEPTEPGIVAVAVGALALVAAAAGIGPALRAAGLDPVAALREE